MFETAVCNIHIGKIVCIHVKNTKGHISFESRFSESFHCEKLHQDSDQL